MKHIINISNNKIMKCYKYKIFCSHMHILYIYNIYIISLLNIFFKLYTVDISKNKIINMLQNSKG